MTDEIQSTTLAQRATATADDLRCAYDAFRASEPDAKWMAPTSAMIRAILNRYDVVPKSAAQPPAAPVETAVAWRVHYCGQWLYFETEAAAEIYTHSNCKAEPLYNFESQAKEPEASGRLCQAASHAVRVGEASADLPTTSEIMDVTAGRDRQPHNGCSAVTVELKQHEETFFRLIRSLLTDVATAKLGVTSGRANELLHKLKHLNDLRAVARNEPQPAGWQPINETTHPSIRSVAASRTEDDVCGMIEFCGTLAGDVPFIVARSTAFGPFDKWMTIPRVESWTAPHGTPTLSRPQLLRDEEAGK